MVGGDEIDVAVLHFREQFGQAAVEIFQTGRVARHVAAVSPIHVEIHKVREDDRIVGRGADLIQRHVEQLFQTDGGQSLGDALRGENVADFADGNDVAAGGFHLVQNGRRGGQDGIVVTTARAFERVLCFAVERAGDDARDDAVFGAFVQQIAGDVADFVQAFQTEMLFMRANLENAVRRRVHDRHARLDAFFAQFFQNHGAGSRLVAQNAFQVRAFAEFVDQIQRKAGIFGGEITPFERDGNARHFPVTGRRVLAFADFFGIAVDGFDFGNGNFHVRRIFAVALLVQFAQSQFAQVGQFQRTRASVFRLARRAGFGDVTQRVRAGVAERFRVGGFAATERIHHQNNCPFHFFTSSLKN